MNRTHTCGELTIDEINKKVTLCGWVYSRRDHGKLVFIDLRDREGFTQVVFLPTRDKEFSAKIKELKNEYVIELTGIVQQRPKGTENPKIKTGQIEILAEDMKILNFSDIPPFEIDEGDNVSEDIRLMYRFLDLRRPAMYKNLQIRHKINKIIRDTLDKQGFLEIETPVLTKSTPEGARDYLVPSRLNHGMFYALPQSPQLFKQILMVSGVDRYFQIAKCFRDEDLRADRQPEFTQLDLEMSFVEEKDIYSVIEDVIKNIFKTILNINVETPFEKISYLDAINRFKTDKPDMRREGEKYKIIWVEEFPLFKYNNDSGKWDMEHHPFTAPCEQDISLLDTDLGKVKARAYDLVINGVEIGSGGIRNHRPDIQNKIFNLIGLKEKEIEDRFGFLLRAFKYGAPPHGGVALGLDRLLSLLVGCETIRDVIAFPKNQKGICPLTTAPSEVFSTQLEDLGIMIKEN